jgi:hypothetical protein
MVCSLLQAAFDARTTRIQGAICRAEEPSVFRQFI